MSRAVLLAAVLLCLNASAQTPVWTHTWNGPGTSGEEAYAGCRDSSGNVYVCGSNEYDMLVAAVRPDGSELWTWRYEPPVGTYCEAADITCGADGNLYICGSAASEDDRGAFCVVSLTPAGTERWRHEWSDPSAWSYYAYRVVWGRDGNVYACGGVADNNTYEDMFVISLTPAGNRRWAFVYDGGLADYDRARDVIWGPDSNLYICGAVTLSDTTYMDFAVLSLTPAGALRWVHAYSSASGGYDVANRLVSDGRNLFAAGVSETAVGENQICVVSLTTAGTRRWVYEKGPGSYSDLTCDIVTGAHGRLFVGGRIYDGSGYSDAIVLGLDSLGVEQWVWDWSNTTTSEEIVYGLAITSDGNIAVAGYTCSVSMQLDILAASLTQSGSERWVRTINGPANSYDGAYAVLAGPAGSAFFVGGISDTLTASDIAVLRLSSSGSTEWTYTWDSGRRDGYDAANCAALAPDGTAYITGSGYWGSVSNSFTVVAVSPTGQESWSYRYSLPGGVYSTGSSVVVGPDNNVYACGYGYDTAYSEVSVCVSVAPSGAERWTAGIGPGSLFSNCVAPDNSGYVCGLLLDQVSGQDFVVAALTSAGSHSWTYKFDGGAEADDVGYSVCYGAESSVYACGFSTTTDGRTVFTVLSLTQAGTPRWVWTDSVIDNVWGMGYRVVSGPDGNIYAGGVVYDTEGKFTVLSFSPSGILRWRYECPAPGLCYSLAVSRDSTIYAAGYLFSDSTFWDVAVVALRPNGETRWIRTVPSPGWSESAASVAVGLDSLVYLAGTTDDDDGKSFFTVVCFDRGGRALWDWRTRGDVRWESNGATWIETRPDGSALVTGCVSGFQTGSDMFTALFAPGIGIAGPVAADPARFRVPSHFRGALVCRLPKLAGPAQVRLVDVAGRVVTEGRVAAGAREFVFAPVVTSRLATGAYFVQLVTAESTRTLRTVKVE